LHAFLAIAWLKIRQNAPITVLDQWRASSCCICGHPCRSRALGSRRGDSGGMGENSRQYVWDYAGGDGEQLLWEIRRDCGVCCD